MKYLYRIVNALLAAAIFPTVIFADLILFRASTSLADAGLEEGINIKFLIDVFTGKEVLWSQLVPEAGTFTWPTALDPIKGRLITFAVCFILALIAALFIFFWSIFSNKRIPIVAATAAGLVSTIVMIACFNSAATLFVDGTINIINVLTDNWLFSLLGGIVSIDMLSLGGFHNGMIILFVFLLVWTGAYYLVELGEDKEEKPAKRK